MPITQIFLTANTTTGGGGGGGGTYPVTLATTGGSIYFSDLNNKIQVTDSLSDFTVGNDDYTVEWWQWMLDTTATNARLFTMGTWPTAKLSLSLESGIGYLWGEGAGGGNNQVANFSYEASDLHNTWTHVAVSRVSGVTKVFFNGGSVLTTGNSYNVVTQDDFVVGNQASQDAGFMGYIKDFRFIKGVGVYSSNFTPPEAPLTATAETKLLFSIDNVLSPTYDSSTSEHNPTFAGANGVDVGPYDLALYVDAGNLLSINPGVSLSTWNDLSPANNDLTLTNVGWSDTDGGRIQFYDGQGTMGYAESPSTIASAQNNITPRASVSFWAVVTNYVGYQHIAGMRGGNKFHVLNLGDGSSFECRIETGNGYSDNYPQIGSRLNTMTHYAFVVNGTRSDFYINGVLSSTTENITGPYTGTLGAFTIAQATGSFQATNLEMGELRYYNRARSPKEIAAEFAATRTRYGV